MSVFICHYSRIPTATNVALEETIDGATIRSVSHSAVEKQQLRSCLAPNAVINIWSCNTAATTQQREKLQSLANELHLSITAKTGEVASGPDGTFINRLADAVAYLLFDQDDGWKTFIPEKKVREKCVEDGPTAYLISKEVIHTGVSDAK